MPSGHRTTARSILALVLLWVLLGTPAAADARVPERIIFPVVGKTIFYDDFGEARGSRRHEGNDLVAARGAAVVAVEGGRVEKHKSSRTGDCMLYLDGRSGTTYVYVHLNNDLTRGNDNRAADCREGVAYALGLRDGQNVRAGELIAYVGNSGNADAGHPHLHFELHPGGAATVSPYRWLVRAPRLLFAVRGGVRPVRLALYGRLTGTDEELSVRIERVVVSRGWRGRPQPRGVSLAYAPGFLVERLSEIGALAAATLASALPGESVAVWTSEFTPTLRTQLARPGVLSAARIRLRGAG